MPSVADGVFTSNTIDPSADIIAIRGDDKNAVHVGNQSNRDVQFQLQNASGLGSNEHVSLALVEGNTMYDPDSTDYAYQTALLITAQHVVVRNNVFANADTAVDVTGLDPSNAGVGVEAGWVDQVAVYNNTH